MDAKVALILGVPDVGKTTTLDTLCFGGYQANGSTTSANAAEEHSCYVSSPSQLPWRVEEIPGCCFEESCCHGAVDCFRHRVDVFVMLLPCRTVASRFTQEMARFLASFENTFQSTCSTTPLSRLTIVT